MQDSVHIITDFFQNVARQESDLLTSLHQSGFAIENNQWRFHLPDLHIFLSQQIQPPLEMNYQEFRKTLFKLSINQNIECHGASITIHDNLNHVDQSCYVMTWVDK